MLPWDRVPKVLTMYVARSTISSLAGWPRHFYASANVRRGERLGWATCELRAAVCSHHGFLEGSQKVRYGLRCMVSGLAAVVLMGVRRGGVDWRGKEEWMGWLDGVIVGVVYSWPSMLGFGRISFL